MTLLFETTMKKLSVVFVLLTCCSGTCKKNPFVERVYSILVTNNSDSYASALLSYQYPDTTIPDSYNRLGGVPPRDFSYFDSREPWKEVFKDLPKDTLSVFYFSLDTIQAYDWQTIRNEYKILKRVDVSLQDLENNNYTVNYP